MNTLNTIKNKARTILKKEGVRRAGIFGSYARGEQRKKSDIDFLIKIDNNLSITDIIKIKLKLEKELNKKVDLIEYDYIHPLIKKQALKEEVRII